MTIRTLLSKTGFALKKHAPAIFTTVGVIGLGTTAYLAYKSRDKVEAVIERIEDARAHDEPVNKVEVAKSLGEALYQPILVGAASVACILMAHKIQSNRIRFLMGALVTEQARNMYFQQKYRKEHGEEAYTKFVTPVDQVERVEIGKNGKEKLTVESVKKEIDLSIGQWYSDSEEYAADDHSYNISYIDSIEDKMATILFQRGHLLLNEVREALGFQRIRTGALLGWTTGDFFNIQKHVVNCGNVEDGETPEQIWVTWSNPKYIYDTVDFNGRYSIYKG
jgi:hypothetical protein